MFRRQCGLARTFVIILVGSHLFAASAEKLDQLPVVDFGTPHVRLDQKSAQEFAATCAVAGDHTTSDVLVSPLFEELRAANVPFWGVGGSALGALRFGAWNLRWHGKDIGTFDDDNDVMALFDTIDDAHKFYRRLHSRFANDPVIKCACCCGSCGSKDMCSSITWRNESKNVYVEKVDVFTAISHNQTYIEAHWTPPYYVPVNRVFPLRSALLGYESLPVPRDFLWFYSHFHEWADSKPDKASTPEYGSGCHDLADPVNLWWKDHLRKGWQPGAYEDTRELEKIAISCAKWLHSHGYASFYGCYDSTVGFDEPEDRGARLQPWRLLAHPPQPEAPALSIWTHRWFVPKARVAVVVLGLVVLGLILMAVALTCPKIATAEIYLTVSAKIFGARHDAREYGTFQRGEA